MADRRADILARLATLLDSVAQELGVQFFHNRVNTTTKDRPCIVMLDATETVRTLGDGRGRRGLSVMLVTLKPEVFGLLKNEEPANEGQSARLSAMRLAMIKAVAADAELVALVGPNGDVVYRGADTDFADSGTMDGKVQMFFEFVYVLNPYN